MHWQHSCPTIQSANAHILDTGLFSDLDFIVGDSKERIPAHKFILVTRSPVFQAKFERWDNQRSCEIVISGMSGNTFTKFLKFLYTNEFDVKMETDAIQILKLAHKYDTPELMGECSKFLENSMSTKNVIHFHQVAKRYDEKDLQEKTMGFIERNAKAVFQADEFLEIEEDTFKSILENDNLQIDELSVFHAAIRWAENECREQEYYLTIGNKRMVLKGLITLIRFPLIHPHDFSDEIVRKNKGILTEEEIVAIYLQLNSLESNKQYLPPCPFNIKPRAESKIYLHALSEMKIQRPIVRARRREREEILKE